MYSTRARVYARILNGLPREEKRVSDKSPPTSRSCVSGSWRAERAARASRLAARATAGRADFRVRRTRRLPGEDPRRRSR